MSDIARPTFKGHQPGLDGIRGLAIVLVLILHFVGINSATNSAERAVIELAQYGAYGVDLFFVLSGFLITGILLDAKRNRNRYFINFYARRTLRIFPLYYGVLLVGLVVVPLFTHVNDDWEAAERGQGWLWTYLANFYVAGEDSWDALGHFTHFWSLAVEEQFYLVWPALVLLVSRRSLEAVCASVIVLGLVARCALAAGDVSDIALGTLTVFRLDTLCTGALLAALVRRDAGLEPWRRLAVPVGIGAAAAVAAVSVVIAATPSDDDPVLWQLRVSLFAVLFGCLVLLALRTGDARTPIARTLELPALRYVGKYSYGLYVYHGILTVQLVAWRSESRLTDALGGHHTLAMVVQFVAATAVSLLVSVLSFELFEKRFLALKGRFANSDISDARQFARQPTLAAGSAGGRFDQR